MLMLHAQKLDRYEFLAGTRILNEFSGLDIKYTW